jgi:hypothetical protein
VIKSESFYQKQHKFYRWTLDLLYHTLCKAMKSNELIKELSKPFIPSIAPIFFPRRIKRVRRAVAAYLEKFTPLSLDASSVKRVVHHSMQLQPQHNVPGSSKKELPTDRDMAKKRLTQNIDNMLDVIYSTAGANPKTIANINATLNRVNKVGSKIRRDK